jgi:endonuclease/exonuclease/phosphatase family metal-dependent hydrolase
MMAANSTRRAFIVSAVLGSWLIALSGCQAGSVKPQSPGTLRVLTYNIHHGEGMDKEFDDRRLAKVIRSLSPDIVALQEVDVGTERASRADQAAILGKLCRMHHVFGQAMPYQGGRYGEAILSRFPIQKVAINPLPYQVGQEPRAALEVLIQPDGLPPIIFVGTHLCHQSGENRIQQTRRIRDLFSDQTPNTRSQAQRDNTSSSSSPAQMSSPAQRSNPIILAGDFNARPGSEPMKVLLDNGWLDTVAPRSKIDYILVRRSDPWQVKQVIIPDDPVTSDHNPVLVVLQWQGR